MDAPNQSLSTKFERCVASTGGQLIDNALVKAIARAHRWREMPENGTHATITEIAAAEKINEFLRWPRIATDFVGAGHR